ncbi:putative DNA-binding transcriptional regulator YafY [Myroides gitamensis]|uniref:helix-turn-helix transcriptional regulator n=1 Tax=Myroides odoratus TaxID=256 RepID=UPI002169832B|nr:YafY family protein [Myroides odoratus]MCS4239871.1 putative DNA-binding transcriptional regulator YafY [Myroides odoratus]MDH6600595.1 putative DNA-binding transcriptional regulator YafY [Myroides gitamensis]
MTDKDTKRLTRLTSILIQLQSKRLLTANELAEKFEISKRTIYRDIRTLEQAGVPVLTEEGKGYTLMEGYRIPPVMFTENEANALITAEQLVRKNKDASLVKDYTDAIHKIKAVLRNNTKDKANLLSERILSAQNLENSRTSNNLSILQLALTNFNLVQIQYYSPYNNETTQRTIEPFAIYTTQENWLLIAFCRLRKDYRSFRLDRIKSLLVLTDSFEKHKITFEEYIEMTLKKCD